MEIERWRRVEQLYHSTLELEQSQRSAFLKESCKDDDALQREVESLLAREGQAEHFMDIPALEVMAKEMAQDATQSSQPSEDDFHLLGRTISHYRVLAKLGGGGMGTVYLAVRDDEQYEKRVAIKVIKRGMDTDVILRRFRQERQIIANLDHPNIAGLLDGGTTEDGLPYFVMEYIEGEPIDEFCDSHRLPIPDRLALFRDVCGAVQYAHQNLVIHRDIKPSNILVTTDGVPKLLDFGIAKLLNPESGGTIEVSLTVQHLMTPDYASPEQVRGDPVTTASDVYSLGVLLYILLSGHRPYRLKTRLPHEVVHVICETEPERPSAAVTRSEESTNLSQAVRFTPESVTEARGGGKPETLRSHIAGDLDNIVLKAMHKESQRRYAYPAQFSEDIDRHLAGLPVIAHPDTPAYRAAKFVRRNRASVAAAAIVLFVLAAGIIVSTWEAHVAHVQRTRAERRLTELRNMTDSLILELPVAIDSGAAKGREVLAEKAVEYLKSLAQDEASDPTLRFELAKAYLAVGLAQGHPAWPSRGNRGRALENYTRAASLFEIVLASDPKNKAARLYLSRTYSDIGLLLLSTSSIESLQAHQHALSVLPPYDSDDWDLQVEYIAAYELIGERFGHPYYANIGDTARGFEYISKAFAIVETMVQRSLPGHADYYSQMIGVASNGSALRLSYGYNMMAGMLWARGQIGNAIRDVRTGIATFISLVGEVPRNGTLRDELAVRYLRLARLLAEDGQIQEALSDLEKTRRLLEPMIQVDAENRIPRRDLAASYNLTGSLLASLGHTKGSLDSYTKAARLSEDLLQLNADAPDEPEIRQHIADSYEGIGNTLAMTSHQADAIKNCLKALSIREVLVKLDPNNARYRSFFAQNHVSIGDIYVKEGDATLAVAFYDKAIHILEPMSSRDPMNWLLLRARADVYMKMGDAERALASSFRAGDRNRGNHVLAARSWYKLGLVLWNEMKAKGTLDRPHARMPAELTRKIASASAAP